MSLPSGQDEEPSLVNASLPRQLSSGSCSFGRTNDYGGFDASTAPFHMLPAERVLNFTEFSTQMNVSTSAIRTLAILSNYRLFVQFLQIGGKSRATASNRPSMAFYNILLRCIESVEIREIFYLYVFCRDGRVARITFDNNENAIYWFRLLLEASQPPKIVNEVFAFSFYARCQSNALAENSKDDSLDEEIIVVREFRRLNFDEKYWRVSRLNGSDYKVCPTYPKFWITPASVSDDELEAASRYRSLKRAPAVVWRHASNGAVLIRSSQPESGIFGWRSPADERLFQRIGEAARRDAPPSDASAVAKPLLILDARSYAAAWANRAKGGGFENKENYQNCDINFLGLANIHAIRYSFQKLRALLWDGTSAATASASAAAAGAAHSATGGNAYSCETTFLQNLDACQWVQHLWALLNSASRVVEALHAQGRCVLVHCSDGWDRTTQIVALAKLMLDPFYRTLEGFKMLVEREWIGFGHKFAERGGLMFGGDPNQRAPVFLQWLDCVRYLLREYPCTFEFNEIYLVKLAQHTYSGLFGTFLCNSARESQSYRVAHRTFSVWNYLNDPERLTFLNFLYAPQPDHHRRFFAQSRDADARVAESLAPESIGTAAAIGKNDNDSAAVTPPPSADRVAVLTPSVRMRDLAPVWRRVYQPHDDPTNWRPLAAAAATLLSSSSTASLTTSAPPPHADDGATAAITVGTTSCRYNVTVHRTHSSDDLPSAGVQAVNAPSHDVTTSCLQRSTSESTLRLAMRDVDSLFDGAASTAAADVESTSRCHADAAAASAPKVDLFFDVPPTNASGGDATAKVHATPDAAEANEKSDLASESRDNEATKRNFGHRKIVFDVDGLQTVVDPVQRRVEHIMLGYEKRLESGQAEIEQLKASLLIMERRANDNSTNRLRRNVSADSELADGDFEPSSVDSRASETSWDALLDRCETNGQPILWMPDHSVTQCLDCGAKFWAIKRRHHCRNCGKVFCAQCTSYECPVPQEQFFKPVRVCYKCYEYLMIQQQAAP